MSDAHRRPSIGLRARVRGRVHVRVVVEGQHTAVNGREQSPVAPQLDQVCVCVCAWMCVWTVRGRFRARRTYQEETEDKMFRRRQSLEFCR